MAANRTLVMGAALTFGLLLLAACGSDDTTATPATSTPTTTTPTATQSSFTTAPTPHPSGSTPEIDECALVTLDELNQIVPNQGFSAAGDLQGDFCHFTATSGLLVEIGTTDLVTPSAAAQALQDSATRTASTRVDGVGDMAYWQASNRQLAIAVGKLGMVIDVFSSAADTSQSTEATAIAKIAIGRLPPP